MNYGIEEMATFKYPSRKPWLVVLIVVVLGLCCFFAVKLSKSRAKGASQAKPVVAEMSTASAVTVARQRAAKPADRPKTDKPAAGKPPVDLVAVDAPRPAVLTAAKGMEQAAELLKNGDRIGARKVLMTTLVAAADTNERDSIESALASVNIELALRPYDMPEKVDHVVERGDSLDKISKKYGVTVQSVEIGNAVKNPDLIKAGDHLRVLDVDFSIEVSKANHELLVLMNGKFFKRYKVGLGKFDKTPLGTFEIYDRIIEPVWWRPDGKEIPFGHEENILGTRWMAIKATGSTVPVKGYGIHGTWDEASIGKSESAGCVRMRNADVEELYNLVPLGTTVTILP